MRNASTLATILMASILYASTAFGQTIGELCGSQYEAADEGFDRTFCDRTPEQMRRQLNKLFSSHRMLFNPNTAALTPRDQSNPRWVEFPAAPAGWLLQLTADEFSTDRAIYATYSRDPQDVSLGEVTWLRMTLQARLYDGHDPDYAYRFGLATWRSPRVVVKRAPRATGENQMRLSSGQDAPCLRLMDNRYDFSWTVGGGEEEPSACPEGYERVRYPYDKPIYADDLDMGMGIVENTIRYYVHDGNPIPNIPDFANR